MNANRQIRILLADAYPLMRQGLTLILNHEADMNVVGQASTGQEAIALLGLHQPDVLLMDLQLPDMSGIEVLTTIRSAFSDARVIIFTAHDGDEDIYQGLNAGAKGYLLKNTSCVELLRAIRIVHAGDIHIPPQVGVKLAERIDSPELSDREREVLRLIAAGKSNQEIGVMLVVTESTVKFHVNNILRKLNVSDRTQAAIKAFKRGIIRL